MEKYLQEYSNYVCEHKAYVRKAFSLLLPFVKANLNLSEEDMIKLVDNIDNHDKSKFEVDEFEPYAKHFYGGVKRTLENSERQLSFMKCATLIMQNSGKVRTYQQYI